MTAPTVYNYDPANGAYVGATAADPSPLDPGQWLIPAHATRVAPPDFAAGQIPVFASGAWTLAPDHRGETWWQAYGRPVLIAAPGDPAANGLTPKEPAPPAPPAPPPPPPPTLEDLAAALAAAADAATNDVSGQIASTQTNLVAFLNAAGIVAGNGGKAPTTAPLKDAFDAQAAAFGLAPEAFAALATDISAGSLRLSAIAVTLKGAARVAKTPADLTAALATFEQALTALVADLNRAGLTVTVRVPDPIKIAGLNAKSVSPLP